MSMLVVSLMTIMGDSSFHPFPTEAIASGEVVPGTLLLNAVNHILCLTSDTSDIADEEHASRCTALVLRLLNSSSQFVTNFQQIGGLRRIVELLVSLTGLLRPHRRTHVSMTLATLECFRLLYFARPSHCAIVAALDSGLLLAYKRLSIMAAGDAVQKLREVAGAFIRSSLITQLIWPDIRRACEIAANRHKIDPMIFDNRWPEWREFVHFFFVCKVNHATFRLNRRSLYVCHNDYVMHISPPASAEDVRMRRRDWYLRHRWVCTRDHPKRNTTVVAGSRKMFVTYSNSDAIRTVALLYALKGVLSLVDAMDTSCTLLVRLDTFAELGPRVCRIHGSVEEVEGYIHIHASVLKVNEEATFLVSTVKLSTFMDVARTPTSQLASLNTLLKELF
ncbi:hypothetical protein HDZ31DRAFT_76787 [Schizophyllum fasciatum]